MTSRICLEELKKTTVHLGIADEPAENQTRGCEIYVRNLSTTQTYSWHIYISPYILMT